MYINKKDDNISKLSFKKDYLQTKPKERIISSPFDIIVKEKQYLTSKELDNRKKLLDFISDKKKLSLKSVFDHKGTKSFLSDKELAMKRIELNENIEKINVDEIENKSIKKVRHKKSADFLLDNNDIIIKLESIKKKKINKKYKSITSKMFGSGLDNKFDNIKNKFMDFELEKLLWEPRSPENKRKRKKLRGKNKTHKNVINLFNLDNSINSIKKIDSINNNKDDNKSNQLVTRDDDPIIKEILNELDVNNNEKFDL